MKKNDFFELEITDIGADGEGIGHYDGMTFFVKDAVIGDRIRARALKLKKNYGYARVEEILVQSPDRVTPQCPIHRQCGGCQIQALSYEKQLEYKNRKVLNHLVRIGGFDEALIRSLMLPIVGMKDSFRYRNKAQFPVGYGRDGEIATGFYAARSHAIIPVEDCLLGVKDNEEILFRIRNWMRMCKIEPYDETTGQGIVRHILLRYGFTTKEIMVCLVINAGKLPYQDELIEVLSDITGMTSISFNINRENTNRILGDTTICIWGQPYITDYIHLKQIPTDEQYAGQTFYREDYQDTDNAIAYRISPQSFYQVNPVQTEKLYSTALAFAELTGQESVWDLYCGIGTISLFLSQKAKLVYGVEIVPQAIEDAKMNAHINGITNTQFFVGKAEEVLPDFYAAKGKGKAGKNSEMLRPDVIVVDPPRKGCDEKCLQTMVAMAPTRIVYVSCDSATLARDLKYLCANGYELKKVQAFDQFAHTGHVETVVLLSQQKPDDHIEIEINLDEIDATSAESKATYKEIEEWVQEHYGFHVTNLNIAQVKQKHGIIERENYNKPKSENSRQPGCPEEKVKAIEEALRYFQMI